MDFKFKLSIGNVCYIDDVIFNTIGVLIGIVIHKLFIKLKKQNYKEIK